MPDPVEPGRLLRLVVERCPEIRQAILHVVEERAELRKADLSISPEFELITRLYPVGVFVPAR